MLDKIKEDITLTDIELHDAKLEEFDIETVLEFAERLILNAGRMWTEMSLNQKQRFQRVLFPEGLTILENGEVGTGVTCTIFNILQTENEANSHLAAPTGIEPVFSD